MPEIASPIVPNADFAGIDGAHVKGGFHVVSNFAAFDTEIPAASGIRKAGMLVMDAGTREVRTLAADLVTLDRLQLADLVETAAERVLEGLAGRFTVQDPAGYVALRVTDEAVTEAVEVRARALGIMDGDNVATVAIDGTSSGGTALADENGLAGLHCDPDGATHLASAFVRAPVFRSHHDRVYSKWFGYDVVMWIWYGQSWSVGTDAVPAINTSPVPGVLTFNGGALQPQSIADNAAVLQSLVPGFERELDGSLFEDHEMTNGAHGETGAVAFAAHLHRLIDLENNIRQGVDHNVEFLVTVPGRGSLTIDKLSDPGEAYINRVLEQIQRAKALCDAAGKTLAVAGVIWEQGTNDAGDATTYPVQMEALRQTVDTMVRTTDDVHGWTGIGLDQAPVKFVSWVTPPRVNPGGAYHRTAAGVYERFITRTQGIYPHIHISGAPYHLETRAAGNQHYSAEGQIQLGRQQAFTAKRAVFDDADPGPLDIVSVKRSGAVVTLTLNPLCSIAVDGARTKPITDYGLSFYTSGDVEIAMASVAIVGGNRIKAVLPSAGQDFAYLEAANTGTNYLPENKWRTQIFDRTFDLIGFDRFLVPGHWAVDS